MRCPTSLLPAPPNLIYMKRLIILLLILTLCLPARSVHPDITQAPDVTASVSLILTLNAPSDAESSSDAEASDPSDICESILSSVSTPCRIDTEYSDDLFLIINCEGGEDEILTLEQSLRTHPMIAAVERDSDIFLTSALTDDYFSDAQYWLNNTGSFTKYMGTGPETIISAADTDIDAPEGWAAYNEFAHHRQAVVAVIDTGIDYRHPDLAEAMWVNPGEIPGNGIDDDGNGYVDDIYGWDFYNGDGDICHYEYSELHEADLASPSDNDNHGTHCAGIIAAVRDNGIGIAGVASGANVRLMSLKIHGGTDRNGTIGSAIKAIRYADMMGADVCNMSWGSYLYSAALYTAIAHSHMLFVCAAGNDGLDNDTSPLYPASFELNNIISVTFTDSEGKLAYNSNYGRKSVDIAVPAVDVFSTVVGTYGLMSGSSMAAPQVSAIAGILYTLGDGMYASNVRDIILSGIKHRDGLETLLTHPGIASLSGTLGACGSLLFDDELPNIHISQHFDGDKLVLSFDTDDDGSGVCNLRYFTGRRKTDYFRNGTGGTEINDLTLPLSKPGIYTFYIDDFAGNSVIRTLRITDDWAAPSITDTAVSVNSKQTKLTITALVSDSQSGLRSVKYLKGCHPASDFKGSAPVTLEPDENGKIKFSVSEEGTYSIYANDLRGNATVIFVYAYIRRATSVTLSRARKTLNPEATWAIKATMLPEKTTDRLTYSSSDESIAAVSSKGIVTAIAPGSCTITVRTSSGKTATCRIKVKNPDAE